MSINRRLLPLFLTSVFLMLLAGCTSDLTTTSSEVTTHHLTGIAYSPDGATIYVADHGNFLIHRADGWLPPPNHFALNSLVVTAKTMYVSGARDDNSDPFGFAKLAADEKSATSLGFDGMNVQQIAASYDTGTLYAYNDPQTNGPAAGLYYTKDDGKTWTPSKMTDMTDKVTALAANAEDERFLAVGTDEGVYFSEDHGDSFQYGIGFFKNVTALSFDITNYDLIFIGTGGKQPAVYPCGNYSQVLSSIKGGFQEYQPLFTLPAGDDITGIAVNRKNDKIAVTTKHNEVFEFDRQTHKLVKLLDNGKVPITQS